MNKIWVGRCMVCRETNGHFQRATYWDAPDEGVIVHPWCLETFYQGLMDEQWMRDMEQAYHVEDERLDNEALLMCLKYRRNLKKRASTQAWNPDSHGVALIGERAFARMYGAKPDTRCFKKDDGHIDIEPLFKWRSGQTKFGEVDVKTSAKIPFAMPVNIKIVQPHRFYVMSQLLDYDGYFKDENYLKDEEWLKQDAKMLGWMRGREVMTFPIKYKWFENNADVHLVPIEKLHSMDKMTAAYAGRWRWNDVVDHPFKHPKEGYHARRRGASAV